MASGQFTWLDLMTNDPKGAVPFYKKVLGWETEDWERPGIPPYTMWKANGESFGGTAEHSEEAQKMDAPPMWLGYISTADIDASLEKAASLGAKIYVGKTEIPETGSFAVLADPQGATVALFHRSPPREGGDGALQILSWTELMTTDVEGACDFYGKLCGWNKTDSMEMPNGGGIYQMVGSGGKSIGGIMKKNPDLPVAAWAYYFKVDDAHKRVEAATKAGAKVMYGPMEVPGGDLAAMLLDPRGAAFGIVSPKA
jgi:uncharacterized protein